jgi:hypothetical protein
VKFVKHSSEKLFVPLILPSNFVQNRLFRGNKEQNRSKNQQQVENKELKRDFRLLIAVNSQLTMD